MKNSISLSIGFGVLFFFSISGIRASNQLNNHLKNAITKASNQNSEIKILWVFFKDKGYTTELQQERELASVKNRLPQKCIERRKKVLEKKELVTFEDIPVFNEYILKLKQMGIKVRTKSRWFNAVSIQTSNEQIEKIKSLSFVKEIKDVAIFRRKNLPEIQAMSSPWQLNKSANTYDLDYGQSFDQLQQIRVPEVHQKGLSGKGVLICIMDSGFRKDHEVFQHANIVVEKDFIFHDNETQQDPNDLFDSSDEHGTITWSNLAGFKEGKLIGPAYGADFLLAKTEYTLNETRTEEDNWVAAIEWADSLGAQVISSSLGYFDWYNFEDLNGNTATITKAADRAVKLGIVVVTSAGNWRGTDWGHVNPPADGDSVIAVGAYDFFANAIAFFSSPGPTFDGRIKPEVCAGGTNNYSADNRGTDLYLRAAGTSVSCPLVAGVAALIIERHPNWSPIDVRNALIYTASQANQPDNDLGWGIVDGFRAVFDTIVSISVQNIIFDDDNIGTSQGNNNNLPEPNETIELSGTLNCDGKIVQSEYAISLSTDDPYIKLSDSVENIKGLVSYGQVEITDAFSFIIDQNVPENHVAVLNLIITDELHNTWKQEIAVQTVIQRNISGTVSDQNTGSGISNSIITWTQLEQASSRIIGIDTVGTDVDGNYNLPLIGGRYAVQVSAPGYSTEDARIIPIPTANSHVDMNLHRAEFQYYPYTFNLEMNAGKQLNETLEIMNTGNTPLFYNIQEKNLTDNSTGTFYKKPKTLLRLDPNDEIPYDLKEIYCEDNGYTITLNIATYREIPSTNHWNISIFLDSDNNQATGYNIAGIGAEFQIFRIESSTKLLKYKNGNWENEIVAVSTSPGKEQISFTFDPSLLSDLEFFSIAVVLREGSTSNSSILRDIIPDDGGLSKITFSRYKSEWLTLEKNYDILQPGKSDSIQLSISFDDSVDNYYGTQLILSTNSPLYGAVEIPINIGNIKTDALNTVNIPDYFDLGQNYPNPFNNQTKIRFSVPFASEVNLMIFNSVGQHVKTLFNSKLNAGVYTVAWDGKNKIGQDSSSGIYFINLFSGNQNKKVKAVLLR